MTGSWVRSCGCAAVLVVLLLASASAQDDTHHRMVAAVRAAMAPALPFPNSDPEGALPANGNTVALWMVRPLQPGDRTIEVIANPLNEANQLRATRAMAQIENNIEAAQRRAALQYDRAVSEAKRTGRSQDVDGVTLYDEGVAGAKIDAESHVTIEVFAGEPSFKLAIETSVQPAVSSQVMIPGAIVLATPSHTFRDSGANIERYAEAQTLVFLGRAVAPEVQKRADHQFEVQAPGTPPMMVIRMRGNDALITELLRKANWKSLLELLP